MRLLLIRHGETEHNIAGVLAGVTDSRLTVHGVTQTQKLGSFLALNQGLHFSRIYASDLQRAYITAEEIQRSQASRWKNDKPVPSVVRLDLLREQDFGSLELVPWASQRAVSIAEASPDFRPRESSESMGLRAQLFLEDFIFPLLAQKSPAEETVSDEHVAVVSHGLFLSIIWQTLVYKISPESVRFGPDARSVGFNDPREFRPNWGNTCYLELSLERLRLPQVVDGQPQSNPGFMGQSPTLRPNITMTIHRVNNRDHLVGLKRTRGGVGSSTYDPRQKSIQGFFNKA